jgi:hypothetical protein
MWYIHGLLSQHQLFLTQEYVDLQKFHSLHHPAEEKKSLQYLIEINASSFVNTFFLPKATTLLPAML